MANTHITTGKYIYELIELDTALKDTAVFPLAQDNLTRKIEARQLRVFINGDNNQPSNEFYYSSAKVEELLGYRDDTISIILRDIEYLNSRIDDLANTVNENYATLDKRITDEVNKLNNRIDQEVETINNRIDQEVEAINNRIDDIYKELVAADDDLRARCTALENRCTALENRCRRIENNLEALEDKLESWILYGSAAPTTSTLPAGRLYIQYF